MPAATTTTTDDPGTTSPTRIFIRDIAVLDECVDGYVTRSDWTVHDVYSRLQARMLQRRYRRGARPWRVNVDGWGVDEDGNRTCETYRTTIVGPPHAGSYPILDELWWTRSLARLERDRERIRAALRKIHGGRTAVDDE